MEKFPINSSCNRNAPPCLQFFVKLPNELIRIWAQMKEKMQNGEIYPEEYARWCQTINKPWVALEGSQALQL